MIDRVDGLRTRAKVVNIWDDNSISPNRQTNSGTFQRFESVRDLLDRLPFYKPYCQSIALTITLYQYFELHHDRKPVA